MTRGGAVRLAVRVGAICLVTAFVLAWPTPARGQDQSTRVVDVILNRSVVVPLANVSHVLIVDDAICRADLESGALRLYGLRRGDTIVVAWIDEKAENLIVRVAPPPAPAGSEAVTTEERDAMGYGTVGTLAHIGVTSGAGRTMSTVTPFAWTEGTARRRFTMNGQVQGARAADASTFTLDTLTAQWSRDSATFRVLDFVVNLDGGAPARITPATATGGFALRGADAFVTKGKSSYEIFAGTTLPWFAASRQIAGMNITRQVNAQRYIDATTAVVRAPVRVDGAATDHQSSVFQTVGIADRLSDRTAVQVRAGAGSSGFYGQGSTGWEGTRASAFVAATGSSSRFGMNQLQLVYAPSAVVQSGANWNVTQRLRAGVGYSHTTTQSTPLFPAPAASDYGSTTVSVAIRRSHTAFANATWNRNVGGLSTAGQLIGRRLDTGINSQFGRRLANNAQVSLGALADPLQLNSRSEFTVRDTATIVIPGGSMNVSVSHDRLSPSLVARLHQQLTVLAPALQPLFLSDPAAFVQSPSMPADVLEILNALEPVDTQLVVSGHFQIDPRLTVDPTVSYRHHAQSAFLTTRNAMVGYSLTWRATPTLDVQSTLSNVLIFNPRQANLARMTIFGIGVRKTLNGAPRWVAPSAGYRIRGRVFRDLNVDGTADQAEPGLPGVTVTLGNGQSTHTNEHGRFEFAGLSAGEYHVLVHLEQLGVGVRVTTPIDHVVRLYERRVDTADFGIVNFSRLMGVVFNDYAVNGVRQADAPGLRDTGLVIEGNGIERHLVTDGAGEFEVDDLPPGRYRLSLDTATLPPNYEPSAAFVDVEVAASATATVSLPVRALRSIAGRVYLRAAVPGAGPIPLKGVTVTAHTAVAVTDDEGRFLLRNLPAGEVIVSLMPIAPLPPELAPPTGRLRMPNGPVQVDAATIVIDNASLVRYFISNADGGSERK